jgi:DNA-binding winged helix-turn-helix (wHTH) protein/TolB-like protein
VPLEPQPARALALLVSRAGEVVTREELRACLWDRDTHVEFDRGISYCIGELRNALRDRADNPRFIETLPRRGFRFIAPVSTSGAIDAANPSPPAPTAPPRAASRARLAIVLSIAVLAIALIAWAIAGRVGRSSRPIVAVSVFDNETGNPQYERIVAGLSDVIVDRLTSLGPSKVGVVGNMATLRRTRADRDLNAIVRETRASFVLIGQLQTRGNGLSLLMQLIRVDDGTHVWVRRIARPAGDALANIDEEAARMVEDAVREHVLHGQRAS